MKMQVNVRCSRKQVEEFESYVEAQWKSYRIVASWWPEDGRKMRTLERRHEDDMGHASWRPVLAKPGPARLIGSILAEVLDADIDKQVASKDWADDNLVFTETWFATNPKE